MSKKLSSKLKKEKHVFLRFLNKFILVMTASDFLLVFAFGLTAPILAVYITDQISNGSLEVVGYGSMIFFIFTSIFRMPIAKMIDKNLAEYDDFYVTVAGYFLMSTIPFLFVFITKPIHLYCLEALNGFSTALAYPGWMALFTRHLNKGNEGASWGFYSTSANIAAAIAAAIGGIVAQRIGFHYLFFSVGVISIFATACLFLIRKDIIIKGHVPKIERIGGKIDLHKKKK